jgi:phage terminase large subunit GpA-like protein
MEINHDSFIINAFARGFTPDPDLTITEWADEHRFLSSVSSAEPGKWKTDRTPYLREIMDALSPSSPYEKVVFMKGAQIGGTECGNNWMGFNICHSPAPMLIVNPTVEAAKRTSKMRIDPAIENCPALCERVKSARSRDSGNTILMKEFPGGVLVLTGANSAIGLRSIPVRYLFLDEIDAFPDDAGAEGDPVDLAVQRTATFNNRKIFMVSTPTIKDASRIEQAFLEGDQRYYHVPCPHCGHYQRLYWRNIMFDSKNLTEAKYKCEQCGALWHDYDKAQILRAGKWVATAPQNKCVASFHLSSLYSPHGWASWTDIAREFLDSKDDPLRLQVWTNTKLAETWEDMAGEQIDPTGLMSRCEQFGNALPAGIVLLTAGVDVQDNRLEIEIVGWGRGEESWSVDYRVLYGDPSTPELWAGLDEMLSRRYLHTKDIADLGVLAACVDSGGHYTDHVINYCHARRVHRIWAIKGAGGAGKPIWPAIASQSNKTKKPVYIIGVNDAKDILMRRLHLTDAAGAGVWHFPATREHDWFEQITNEIVRKKFSKGRLIREWTPRKECVRTEALDCRVYAYAALRGLVRGYRLNLDLEADKLAETKIKKPQPVTPPTSADAKDATEQPVAPNLATVPRHRRVRSRGIDIWK